MKKIIVCGDSFMAPVVSHPGTHFTEIISSKLGWELEIYARGGMSNPGICLQVESAIKARPDFICLNTTFGDRIEIQTDDDSYNYNFTVDNIIYKHPQSTSSLNPQFNQSPRLMIDTIFYFLDHTSNLGKYDGLVKDLNLKRDIVKQWFTHIHKNDWKVKTDRWCLYAVLHQLELSGIPYLLLLDPNNMYNMCPWLNEKKYLNNASEVYKKYKLDPNLPDPGYHTSPESQVEIAREITEWFKKYF